jgi:chromatin segregation and condensation protein Rec8/ScpA/Scc1 (kleisin family)
MEVQQLYQKHREPQTRPSLADFFQVLCSTVAEYSQVFLVVDALDEYPEESREVLLENLPNLGPNVNLILTSRPHIDLSSAFPETQTLEIRATAEDILQYVNAQMDHSPRLSKHVKARPQLRQEIEKLSIERSKGMYVTY